MPNPRGRGTPPRVVRGEPASSLLRARPLPLTLVRFAAQAPEGRGDFLTPLRQSYSAASMPCLNVDGTPSNFDLARLPSQNP